MKVFSIVCFDFIFLAVTLWLGVHCKWFFNRDFYLIRLESVLKEFKDSLKNLSSVLMYLKFFQYDKIFFLSLVLQEIKYLKV